MKTFIKLFDYVFDPFCYTNDQRDKDFNYFVMSMMLKKHLDTFHEKN